MIIFLYGKDSYRSRRKLNEIIEEYKKTHASLSFIDFDEPGFSVRDLKDQSRQFSIFKEKKLVVVSNLFSNKEEKEAFEEELKDLLKSEDIIIVYEGDSIKATDTLFKKLKKDSKAQEFTPLEGAKLREWIENEFKLNKASIDAQALDFLLRSVGDNLWLAANEIKKISSFKKTISTADLRLFLKPKITNDIFKTIDAIAQKDKKTALSLINKHLESGDSPFYLLSMIGYQIRNLLIVKELIEKNNPYEAIVKKSGLHPFVVKKSYAMSRAFSFADLKKIYQKMFEADLSAKTGKIEPDLALELLIASI